MSRKSVNEQLLEIERDAREKREASATSTLISAQLTGLISVTTGPLQLKLREALAIHESGF